MKIGRTHQTQPTVVVKKSGWVSVTRALGPSLRPGKRPVGQVLLQLGEQVAEHPVHPILLPQVQTKLCTGKPDVEPQAGRWRLAGEL